MPTGKLLVTLHRAEVNAGGCGCTQPTTYAVVQLGTVVNRRLGGQQFRTVRAKGYEPSFEQVFTFDVREGDPNVVQINFFSPSFLGDDAVGATSIPLSGVLSMGSTRANYPLLDVHGRQTGLVEVSMKWEGARKPAMDYLRSVFEKVDKNHDGQIDKRELIIALRKDPDVSALMQLPANIRQEDGTRDTFERVFQSIDADDSRTITWSEFLTYFERNLAQDQAQYRERPPDAYRPWNPYHVPDTAGYNPTRMGGPFMPGGYHGQPAPGTYSTGYPANGTGGPGEQGYATGYAAGPPPSGYPQNQGPPPGYPTH